MSESLPTVPWIKRSIELLMEDQVVSPQALQVINIKHSKSGAARVLLSDGFHSIWSSFTTTAIQRLQTAMPDIKSVEDLMGGTIRPISCQIVYCVKLEQFQLNICSCTLVGGLGNGAFGEPEYIYISSKNELTKLSKLIRSTIKVSPAHQRPLKDSVFISRLKNEDGGLVAMKLNEISAWRKEISDQDHENNNQHHEEDQEPELQFSLMPSQYADDNDDNNTMMQESQQINDTPEIISNNDDDDDNNDNDDDENDDNDDDDDDDLSDLHPPSQEQSQEPGLQNINNDDDDNIVSEEKNNLSKKRSDMDIKREGDVNMNNKKIKISRKNINIIRESPRKHAHSSSAALPKPITPKKKKSPMKKKKVIKPTITFPEKKNNNANNVQSMKVNKEKLINITMLSCNQLINIRDIMGNIKANLNR